MAWVCDVCSLNVCADVILYAHDFLSGWAVCIHGLCMCVFKSMFELVTCRYVCT